MADPDEVKPSEQKEGSSYTIEEYLSDKGEKGRQFWDGLVALARRCGEFQFAPAKTRSGLMLRARFVVVFTLSDRGMTFGLSMASPHEHPRIRKIDQVGAHEYFHRIRVASLDELDDELGELICLAYQWGLVGAK